MTVQNIPAFLQNATGTNANVFRAAATAPFSGGGVLSGGELGVRAQSTPNMTVSVNAGRAKVAGTAVSPPSGFTFTTQGFYDVLNDAALTVTIATSNATQPRIDVVCVQVQDSFYAGSINSASITVVTGVAASTPTVPAIPANSLALAYVAVAANTTSIVSANITNVAASASLLNQNYVRSYSNQVSTGSIANGVSIDSRAIPAIPVASRIVVDVLGVGGFATADGSHFVQVTSSAGTLHEVNVYGGFAASGQRTAMATKAYIDMPANTATTLYLSAQQSGGATNGYYSLGWEARVLLAGEFA